MTVTAPPRGPQTGRDRNLERRVADLEALIARPEGKTQKQKNPHPHHTLAWAAWCIARLGGWNGYASERPPGPVTFANGLKRFHAITEGFALANPN